MEEVTCWPLQDLNDLNKIQEEPILYLTADKVFINSIVIFNINNSDK